jgi:hypothetical protein
MPVPTTFSAEIADRLLSLIEEGASLRRACEEVGVARRTVRTWLAEFPDFAQEHRAACQLRLQSLSDDVVDLADGAVGGDNAAVQAARLQVDSRRWLLSKLAPATYGDKIEVAGAGGEALIPANGASQVPKLMQTLAILLPGTSNADLMSLATKLIERAAPALPAPGGER